MWACRHVGTWGPEDEGRGEMATCHCNGEARTVFSRRLTSVQKHFTPFAPSQAQCGLCWGNRGLVSGAGSAASGRGERDSARPWHAAVQMERGCEEGTGIGDGRRDHRAWPGAGHMEGKRQGKQGVIWTPSLGSSVKALLW